MATTIINHPFGNGVYHLGDDWGMVYEIVLKCLKHITCIICDVKIQILRNHFISKYMIYE